MTLIVGAQCSDGIVFGADSGATYVAGNVGIVPGMETAMQPTSKLHIIHDSVLMGVSGAVGLAQLYVDRIEEMWKGPQLKQSQVTVAGAQRRIEEAILKDAGDAIDRANRFFGPTMGQNALSMVSTHSLVALPVGRNKVLTMFQVDFQGRTEAASDDLPFAAIGSGQVIADPFLAFLRRVFWRDSSLTLQDGIFATVWTLQHAIKESPGGLSGPVEVAILDSNGAKMLPSDELEDHLQHVDSFENDMKKYRIPTESSETPPIPQLT